MQKGAAIGTFYYHGALTEGMAKKRVLAIHDISCFGRCSLTVALPIISATGTECTVMPTAVLSTHTGGFTGYTYRDLTDDLIPIMEHWKTLDLKFDYIYTGFLGSFEQIDLVSRIIDEFGGKDTKIVVDPVMGDKGKLYPVFSKDFPKGMKELCRKANVIIPNMTEATMMLEEEYREGPYTQNYIEGLLERLNKMGAKDIVLTGVYFDNEHLGAAAYDSKTKNISYYFQNLVPGYYHGTGDVFGSVVTASLVNGLDIFKATELAVNFTAESVKRTKEAGTDIRYGVDFEEGLEDMIRCIRENKKEIRFAGVFNAKELSEMAEEIWMEYFPPILGNSETKYVTDKFQSEKAIAEQMEEGYLYYFIEYKGKNVGYCSLRPDGDSLFMSKLYLLKEYRGKGLGSKALDEILERGRAMNVKKIYLKANKFNRPAIDIYTHKGFSIVEESRTEIGNGICLDDYMMEYVF